jgi:hypothetical protein
METSPRPLARKGENVQPRKHFIQTHAKSVRNLDV